MPGEATNQMKIRDAFKPLGVGDDQETCLTTYGLAIFTGLSHRTIGKAVGGLILRGYLRREERGCAEHERP